MSGDIRACGLWRGWEASTCKTHDLGHVTGVDRNVAERCDSVQPHAFAIMASHKIKEYHLPVPYVIIRMSMLIRNQSIPRVMDVDHDRRSQMGNRGEVLTHFVQRSRQPNSVSHFHHNHRVYRVQGLPGKDGNVGDICWPKVNISDDQSRVGQARSRGQTGRMTLY